MGVYIELPKEWAKWSLEVTDVHDNILEAKTTDIDLVRCGECLNNRINVDGVAESWCYHFGYEVEPTDFCSYGERRAE